MRTKHVKLATKTLATLMIVTVLSVSIIASDGAKANAATLPRREARLERLQQHHDRKMELRASVLGITPTELKAELKTQSFDQVLKSHGFTDKKAYYVALIGKLKTELKQRGWTDSKINDFIQKQQARHQSTL